MINIAIYIISTIVFIALIIWAYNTPKRKAYDDWYAKKMGYWDTILCIILLVVYNIWTYSVMGLNSLLFPITLVFDILFILAIISSILRVRRVRKKKNK